MARRQPTLVVIISLDVAEELDEIWRYNASAWSPRQAEAWDRFLRMGIRKLASQYALGKPVDGFPELRHLALKKRRNADGHIVV